MSHTQRILIVNNEADIRDIVRISLEEFRHWQPLVAASGIDGLQLAQREPIDAILLSQS